jgi:uncharacterized protein involved in exopolysaccharide biosynthesis
MEELRLIPGSAPTPTLTLRDVLGVMFRQGRIVAISFALIVVGAIAYRLVAPSYQAEMKILVSRGRQDPALTPTPTQPEIEREEVTEEDLNSEVELLHDGEILRTVAQASGMFPEPGFSLGKFLGQSDDERLERVVRRIGRRLEVEPTRKTTLITVTYDSSSPEQAANVLTCLAGAYLERHSRLHRPGGETIFFEQQINQSRRNLEDAEMQLKDFTRGEGVISAAQQRDITLQKLGEIEAGDRANQVEIAATSQRLRVLQTKLPALPERVTTVIRNADNPQLMGKLKSKLLDLELKRTELLTKYEPSYRLVQEVDRQIADTKGLIAQEELAPLRDQSTDLDPNHAWAKSELVKAQVDLAALQARAIAGRQLLTSYESEAATLGNDAIKQDELLSNLKAAEEQYLLYLGKREEARIGDALDQQRILNVRVAEEPAAPALPQRSALTFGLLAFLFAGTVSTSLAFAADRLDPSFRTPDEVVACLKTPVLASLPRGDMGRELIDSEDNS